MKKIRLLIITIMVIFAMIAMSACGTSNKTNDSNKKAEQTQASGDSGSPENSNNTGNSANAGNSSSGSVSIGDKLKWPKELMGNLPEPKGKITVVLKDVNQGQCTVGFTDMSKEDANSYASKIKEIGYKGELEISDAESIVTMGTAKDGSQACFTYKVTAKEGSISYISKPSNSKTDNSTSPSVNTPPDMTDAMPWPKDFIKGVPELKGKIVDVVNRNGNNVSVYLEYVDKTDFEKYIKQLKENGFTVESDETSSVDSADFRASNADGSFVHAYLSISEGGNRATVDMEKASK